MNWNNSKYLGEGLLTLVKEGTHMSPAIFEERKAKVLIYDSEDKPNVMFKMAHSASGLLQDVLAEIPETVFIIMFKMAHNASGLLQDVLAEIPETVFIIRFEDENGNVHIFRGRTVDYDEVTNYWFTDFAGYTQMCGDGTSYEVTP